MHSTPFYRAIAILLLAAAATACVDHSYDLDKLDPTARFSGSGIDLPLLSTEKITIDGFIGDDFDEMITRNANGTYSISYDSDPYDLSFLMPQDIDRTLGLKRYKGRYIDVDFSLLTKPTSSSIQFDENGVADLSKRITTRKIPSKTYRLPFSIPNIPSELNGLSGLTLTDESVVRITIFVPDCLLTEGTITPDINFDLHELFEVEGFPDGIVNFNDVRLSRENNFSASRDLHLKKVVVADGALNSKTHTLDINAHLSFSGNIVIDDPKTTRARYQSAPGSNNLIVRVQMVDLLCKGIEGKFVYEVDSVRTRIKMGKIAEKFGGDDTPVTFTAPELHFSYTGDFSVPTHATATFVAQRNGVTTAQISNVKFDLPVANGSNKVSRVYRFSSSGSSASGMVGVKADIPKLFKPVPDIIYVYLDIATDETKTGVLDLDRDYQLQLSMEVSSPLAYGPGLKLDYSDSFDLPDFFTTLLKDNRVKLVGELTNTSPLQLDMDFILINKAGGAVVAPASQHIAANGTSTVEMDFGPLSDYAALISQALIQLSAKAAGSNKAIKASDYIQASFRLQLPEGYTYLHPDGHTEPF